MLICEMYDPERDDIATQLSELLNTFRTDELSLDTINEEVETVRQQLYDHQNHQNHLRYECLD